MKDLKTAVAYLDGELDAEAARNFEAKLRADGSLRAEVQTLQRTWNLLDCLPWPEPSDAFVSLVLERIFSQRYPGPRKGRLRGFRTEDPEPLSAEISLPPAYGLCSGEVSQAAPKCCQHVAVPLNGHKRYSRFRRCGLQPPG
jgi:hypothetical protein